MSEVKVVYFCKQVRTILTTPELLASLDTQVEVFCVLRHAIAAQRYLDII